MNKLVIDNDVVNKHILIDEDADIEINLIDVSRNIKIELMPGVCLRVFDKSQNTKNIIEYAVNQNCKVFVNKLSIDSSDDITLNLNGEGSFVIFNTSIINYKDNEFREVINHNVPKCESKIRNHAINVKDNTFKFIVDGVVKKGSIKTTFKQDNKIINLNSGKSFILPNLIVDNDDIEASHSAYIGSFDLDSKFYMMTRGIDEKTCDILLMKAFLLNNMNLDEKEKSVFESMIENI